METLANGADTDEEHGEAAERIGIARAGEIRFLVIAVDMANERMRGEAAVEESLASKFRGAKKASSEAILLVFFFENIGLKGVFVAGRKKNAETLAFALNGFVGKAGMRVGTFENGGDAKLLRGLESFESAKRPGMDDVDLASEMAQAARDDVVMESEGTITAEQLVGNAKFAASDGGGNANFGRHRALDRTSLKENIGASRSQARDLLPGGVANACRADFVGEAVEDANFARVLNHWR